MDGIESQPPDDSTHPKGPDDDFAQASADAVLPDHPDAARQLAEVFTGPLARVRLPPDEQMQLRTVSAEALRHFYEASGARDFWVSGAVLFIGALLGFFGNLVTAQGFSWAYPSVGLVCGVSVGAGIFGLGAVRASRVLARAKDRLGLEEPGG